MDLHDVADARSDVGDGRRVAPLLDGYEHFCAPCGVEEVHVTVLDEHAVVDEEPGNVICGAGRLLVRMESHDQVSARIQPALDRNRGVHLLELPEDVPQVLGGVALAVEARAARAGCLLAVHGFALVSVECAVWLLKATRESSEKWGFCLEKHNDPMRAWHEVGVGGVSVMAANHRGNPPVPKRRRAAQRGSRGCSARGSRGRRPLPTGDGAHAGHP